jgi:hypothetical protein
VYYVILRINSGYSPKQHEQIGTVMEKQCVFCQVWTEFLTIIYMNFKIQRCKARMISAARKRHENESVINV